MFLFAVGQLKEKSTRYRSCFSLSHFCFIAVENQEQRHKIKIFEFPAGALGKQVVCSLFAIP